VHRGAYPVKADVDHGRVEVRHERAEDDDRGEPPHGGGDGRCGFRTANVLGDGRPA
jgi:hypothetical protein